MRSITVSSEQRRSSEQGEVEFRGGKLSNGGIDETIPPFSQVVELSPSSGVVCKPDLFCCVKFQ